MTERWVLLRGLMREQRHWGDFPAQLAQALPDAVIVTPDLPGNGSQHRQPSPTRVAAMVDACRADLRQRGLAPPYALLALSLGGMAAVDWASRYPDEISRCVLVNTSMRPYSRFYQRLRWRNYPVLLAQLLRGGHAARERLILRLTSNHHGAASVAGGALLARWTRYQHDAPVSAPNGLRQLLAAARFRAPSSRPAVPLLLLASRADRLVDARCSRQLAAAWQAPLVLHPSAGHDLPLDDGAWLIARLRDWLAEPIE
ncbi:MAG: alpha/beta fold hydrolase [Sphingomonadaceae bacterium]